MLIVLALLLIQAPQSSLEGRVIALGADHAITQARLVLTKVQGQLENIRTTTTDESGRFSIPNLAPGQYRLFAERDGYLRTEYGQRGASRTGTIITVGGGQDLQNIVVTMTPTGVIAGRIRDVYGHPIRNVAVHALKATYREGRRNLNLVQMAQTDDLGEYRIFGLPPGLYFVSALPAPGPHIEGDTYVVPTIPSRENGNRRETRTPGPAAIAAGIVDPAVFDRETFMTVYYPGTTDVTSAAPIDLQPGMIVGSIDFGTARTSTVNVRGRVINGVTGQPAENVSVSVVQAGGTGISRSGEAAMGRFDIPGVTAGSHVVIAQTTNLRERLFVRLPIDVDDQDIENLSLILRPGFTLTGRFIVEGVPNLPAPRPYVQLQPEDSLGGGYSVPVSADGIFTIPNASAGNYKLRIPGLPQTWYIKSAMLGTIDLLNAGLRLETALQIPLNIEVSASGGIFDAKVLDAERRPAQGITVALIPDRTRRVRYDLYKTGTTDVSGRVRFQGIAPGEYNAFAWADIDADSWQDPAVLRLYENRAEPVRFDEGAQRSVTLTIIGRSR